VPQPSLAFHFEPLAPGADQTLALEPMLDPGAAAAPAGVGRIPAFIARLDGGSVLGLSYIPVTSDLATCLSAFSHNPYNPFNIRNGEAPGTIEVEGETRNPQRIVARFDAADDYDEGVVIGNHDNFGHWLYNHLSRVSLAAAAPRLQGVPLLVGENVTRTQLECLEHLGYPEAKLIRLRRGRLARFRTLWAPMMPLCGINGLLYWSPGAVESLRERLRIKRAAGQGRRLYLTRRASRWRRVVNEDELLEKLKHWRFEVIDPGALSIAQQLELAADTEAIVGPFGASMNMLLFAPAGARVVEMNFQTTNMDINPVLCHRFGQPYAVVKAQPVVEGDDPLHYDLTADPARVEAALEALGLRPPDPTTR
jgi:capsular polysaccharide biosynthesis protein